MSPTKEQTEARRVSIRKARANIKSNKSVNLREYLNTAGVLADMMLDKLRPVIEASPDGVLDRDARETYKLALEGLKTVRELQLKAKALDHAIRQSKRDEQTNSLGELPALKTITSSQLMQIIQADDADVSKRGK